MKNKIKIDTEFYEKARVKHFFQGIIVFLIPLFIAYYNELFSGNKLIPTLVILVSAFIWFGIVQIRLYSKKIIEFEFIKKEVVKLQYMSFWNKKELILNEKTEINIKIPEYSNRSSSTIMYSTLTIKNPNETLRFKLTIQDAVNSYIFVHECLNLKMNGNVIRKIRDLSNDENFIHLKNIII